MSRRGSRVSLVPRTFCCTGGFDVEHGPSTRSVGHQDQIAALFPALYGEPAVVLRATESRADENAPLKIGVVLSGGQASGGHNVVSGILDFLQRYHPGSKLLGFRKGPIGIMSGDAVEITLDAMYPYRNQGGFDIICSGRDKIESSEQLEMAAATVSKLGLDGLVVIGGDDSNTNAAVLAQFFRGKGLPTKVLGVPKTIDGDLKNEQVATSFGFDTACRVYAEAVGNIMIDSASADKYYHFVRLMGRAASHIALEVALQTHPQLCLISEEVQTKGITLQQIATQIADIVAARSAAGISHGVILIPEGLIEFLPHADELLRELNEIMATSAGRLSLEATAAMLTTGSAELFSFLPRSIAEQLMLDRDPHGNVQVAQIETEQLLIQVVKAELAARKAAGTFSGKFAAIGHYFGYEGRCALPSNFDATYCYNLGYAAGALASKGKTGMMAAVSNLERPARQWTVGGVPLTSMMRVERRKGKDKPVIQKALVKLDGGPFTAYAAKREEWGLHDCYRSPGPIQFQGGLANEATLTLAAEINRGHPILF
mmetsp:Transcript_31743/g.81309  ORF Transcript_31743/g.81309 Transcript_31743/m.81309 type:complete len:543 (+) Transcript_31743:122-1750(+)